MTSVLAVGVSSTKLIETNPSDLTEAVKKALLNTSSVPNAVFNTARHGFSGQFIKYYNYGKDHFVNGLPEVRAYTPARGNTDSLKQTLIQVETSRGEENVTDVILEFMDFREPTSDDIAKNYMFFHQGYNSVTGIVSTAHADLRLSRLAEIKFKSSEWVSTRLVRITYQIFDSDGNELNPTFDIKTQPFSRKYSLYVSYKAKIGDNVDDTTVRNWFYLVGSGEFPVLDALWTGANNFYDTYFPIAPIRIEGANVIDRNDALKTSTDRLLDKVGLSLKQITDSLNGDPDNPNNTNNIDDAYVGMFASVDSENPVVIRYLMEVFKEAENFFGVQTNPAQVLQDYIDGTSSAAPTRTFDLYDGVKDPIARPYAEWSNQIQYDTDVRWHYAETSTRTGSIGVVGHATRSITTGDNDRARFWDKSYIVYEHQVSANTIETVKVVGLVNNTAVVPNNVNGYATYHLEDLLKTDNKGQMFIPLRKTLTDTFDTITQDKLFTECLQLIVYAEQWTKLRWYQTQTFKLFVTVAAIAIAIVTLQPQLATMIAASSVYAAAQIALQVILENILLSWIIEQALILVVDAIGVEAATFLAVALAATGAVYGTGNLPILDLPVAETLLNLTVGLVKQTNIQIQDELLDLQREQELFAESVEEKQKELDEALDGLNSGIDPLYLVSSTSTIHLNENPTDFYLRTLQTNPGVAALDAVTNYVDNALTLPKNYT